jgi:hypothetical protein
MSAVTIPTDVIDRFPEDVEYKSSFDKFRATPMSDEDMQMLNDDMARRRDAWNELSGKEL